MAISDALRTQVKAIICDILELDPDDVTESSRFIEDHGADSLQAIEILANLERELAITLDQTDLTRMTTLQEVCAVIEEAGARI
ncbi:MAG TPA: acyl carrier protein [Pseudonocardiaceae bacterium]|jgi:acyl carrier protein